MSQTCHTTLTEFLSDQRQLGLDRAGVVTMLDRRRDDGLWTTEPVELTPEGRAVLEELTAAVAPVTRQVFAGLDRDDLAVAHRVLIALIQRARTITSIG